MMGNYILSHDIGTTNHKCVVFNEQGEMVASASRSYTTYYSSGGYAEQDANDWYVNFLETTTQVLEKISAKDIAVLTFSGHMNGCLPVSSLGIPLMRSMIHADTRSSEMEEEVFRRVDEDRLYEKTGNRIDSRYPLLKMFWLKTKKPEIYRNTAYFLQAKDFLVYKVTGHLGVTDYSDASLTGAFNVREKSWETTVFSESGLDVGKMPNAVPSIEVVGAVQKQVAEQTGLLEGTPVVIGGGDGACATVGAGCLRENDSYISLGTTAWVSKIVATPFIDKEKRVFTICDLNPKYYNTNGTMQTAGAAYEWVIQLLSSITDWSKMEMKPEYAQFENQIKNVPAGARGIIFHPYLLGERSPVWNDKARGSLFGLNLEHDRFDVAKAVLEGIAYSLQSIAEIMDPDKTEREIRIIGGLAKSENLIQIISDVFQQPLSVTENSSLATSLGAAIAGGVGVKMFPSFEACENMFQNGSQYCPNKENADIYIRQFHLFKGVYERIKDIHFLS